MELKDLKWYLGTGLKVQGQTNGDIFELGGMDGDIALLVGAGRVDLFDIRPILLPLSELTEPLKDGSVPIVELAKISFPNHETIRINEDKTMALIDSGGQYDFKFKDGSFECVYLRYSASVLFCRVDNQLQLFEYLYANHFWLGDQSWFEKGIIIDKRTVK